MIDQMKPKSKAHWYAFFVCLLVSVGLMIGGAITPPPFQIHSSIFTAVGWLFGFAALSQVPAVIDSGTSARIKKGDTTLTIGEEDDILKD